MQHGCGLCGYWHQTEAKARRNECISQHVQMCYKCVMRACTSLQRPAGCGSLRPKATAMVSAVAKDVGSAGDTVIILTMCHILM
jgi:hypothetical protein